jgi:hypothetical protein
MIRIFLFVCLLFNFSEIYSKEKFSTVYTDFSKDCKSDPKESEGSDAGLICKGPNGYIVLVSYSACFESVSIESKDKKERVDFESQPIGTADKRKLEWRIFQKKPIGVIYHLEIMKDTDSGNCPQEKTGKQNLCFF